jgi:hypothetical protein
VQPPRRREAWLVTNVRSRASEHEGKRNWPRVWFWPIPHDVYVDPETVRKYLEEEAERGAHVDPVEVRAYFERDTRTGAPGSGKTRPVLGRHRVES